jgi:hypothetical protein
VTSTGDGATVIANDAVTTDKIADSAVSTAKIADDAVTAAKLNAALNDLSNVNASPSDGQVLKWVNASSEWQAADDTGGGSGGGISNVSEDTTPQLGGDLDVNGNSIVSASNGDIAVTPNGTGKVILDGINWPTADGSADQVLKTDGSGQLSFTAGGGSGTVTSVGGTGTVSGLTLSGTVTSSGDLTLGGTLSADLTSDVTGNLPDGNIASASTWNAKQDAVTAGTGLSFSGATLNAEVTQSEVDAKQDTLTFGIVNTNAVKVDAVDVADDEYARFTASGLESRSGSEVLSDIGAAASAHAHSAYAEKASSNTWTAAQQGNTQTAAFSALSSGVLDFDTYQNFVITLGSGTNTFTNPTADAGNTGQTGTIVLIQPSSGAAGTMAVTASGDYKPVGGAAPSLSSTNSAVDIIPYMIQADNTILLGAPQLDLKATS